MAAEIQLPPQAPQLEKAILGACLLERDAFTEASQYLRAEMFYERFNALVWGAMQKLAIAHRPIDYLTVGEALGPDLEVIGGLYFLTVLTDSVASSAHIEAHAQIVADKYRLREVIRISNDSARQAYEVGASAREVVEGAASGLTALTLDGSGKEPRQVIQVAFERFQELDNARKQDSRLIGVPTGLDTLDLLTGGWRAPDLIILAARPSVGKTALALNLARNGAMSRVKPTPTAFFSLEMSEGQLVDRMLASESGVPLERIVSARASDKEMTTLYEQGLQPLADCPLYIDDTAALTLTELRAKARKLKRDSSIGLIIIDYLQLMSGERTKGESREQEISRISRGLKGLAKELSIPIIALSQLSRKGDNAEPQLSDLRESGAIEQDADIVCFIIRDDYQQASPDPMVQGHAKLKFAKHRNGAIETLPMRVDLTIQKWYTPYQFETRNNSPF